MPREEVFVTSKFWNNFGTPETVEMCVDKILGDMKLDYLDLLLAHWPVAFQPISFENLKTAKAVPGASMADKGIKQHDDGNEVIDWEHTSTPIAKAAGKDGSYVPTWNAMKKLVANGKAKAIGVSNFGIKDLELILPHAKDIPISCNQVEVHPWLPNQELIDYCRKHDILVSCYSPFAGQKKDGSTLMQDPTVKKLAEKNDMDLGQLLQSWAVQRGTIPLGKSQNESTSVVLPFVIATDIVCF